MTFRVPPSSEVIAEEIEVKLEENGIPRGGLIRAYVRAVAEEVAIVGQFPFFCPRCGTQLEWRHQSAQCPHCRWKEGCCEGAPGG